MFEDIISLIDRHSSFILTTHDYPDADGLGAEMVLAYILKKKGKDFRIINSSLVPVTLKFIGYGSNFEKYDKKEHARVFKNSALVILDAYELHHLGAIGEVLEKAKEVFIFDHHESKPQLNYSGFFDPDASSTSEMAVELACRMNVELDPKTATAAYAGIVHDSGFFAYPKTSIRTFKAAIKTLEWGADPNYIYRQLMENSSYGAILLQRQALLNLEFHAGKRIAVIVLRMEDYQTTGAEYEEAENIVNIPLKTKEVEVSILIKENPEGDIRCSLRSKGLVNVSKIAQSFGGGGHHTAAGFKCSLSTEETIKKVLAAVEAWLNGQDGK